MSGTGTALVNARTPTAAPSDQLGHGQVTYKSPEEQHAELMAALHDAPPPKNQQPGTKRRIIAKPKNLAAPYGNPAILQAIAALIHNQEEVGAFLHYLDDNTKEALLSALADDLGLSIE